MALRLGALYDALRSASIDDDIAKAAAEEVAGYQSQLADLKSDVNLLKWMVGTNVTLTIVNIAATMAVLYRLAGGS